MDERPRLLLPAVAGLLVLGALAFAIYANSTGKSGTAAPASTTAGTADGSGFDGAALPAGVKAPPFTLTDQTGHPLSLSSLRGRPVLIAFPYTGCRNSCILIAQQIRGALDELSSPPAVLLLDASGRERVLYGPEQLTPEALSHDIRKLQGG